MFEWTEQQRAMRREVRRFIEAEVEPNVTDLESGRLLPYPVLRRMYSCLGLDELAEQRFRRRIEREALAAQGAQPERRARSVEERANDIAVGLIPTLELSRHCPGLAAALNASTGLAGHAIMARGSTQQKLSWGQPL